jgi:hypothetical protein
MGTVCVFSHNTSLGSRQQKLIGAPNSAWIKGKGKPEIFGPCWAVSGLFVVFRAVLAVSCLYGPFCVFSDRLGLFRALEKHLEPVTGHVGTIWVVSDHFGAVWAISGHFRVFQVV